MPFKKHKPEEIIGKLREAEIVLEQGASTAEACRRIAVSEQTYYRWRKEYGGAKGRFEHLMASIPVKLMVHPQPGLLGAAAAFAVMRNSPAAQDD